jgi:hypothetical protein
LNQPPNARFQKAEAEETAAAKAEAEGGAEAGEAEAGAAEAAEVKAGADEVGAIGVFRSTMSIHHPLTQ